MAANNNKPVRLGATPDDWNTLSLLAGLTEDLLPVVSNPNAAISPDSKIKEPCKSPSVYNADRKVAGLPKWTQRVATDAEVVRWQAVPDYGICIQTRNVRALDVDVTDPLEAHRIREFLTDRFDCMGCMPPVRARSNSSKFLMAFYVDAPGVVLTKRVLKVKGGIVEFLATGQQFVAVGTHTSGVRYMWEDGTPWDFPTISLQGFETLWADLVMVFGLEDVIEYSAAKALTEARKPPTAVDPLAEYLRAEGWVKSETRDGRLNVRCPFEDEHTSESSESATQYFQAGVGGFEQGHFRCLHAHCAHRNDGDYRVAIGYGAADFDVIVPAVGEDLPPPKPALQRDNQGRVLATVDNMMIALRASHFTGWRIALDTFRDEIMAAPNGTDEWRQFGDDDYTRLRQVLESPRCGFKPVGRELIRDVVFVVAKDNAFDSAQLWLQGLRWDGVPRVERFVHRYFGAEDSAYVRAVSVYLWTALAGRVLVPGCKADMVPIWVGGQGTGKSTGTAALVPSSDFFTEISFHEKDEDLARKMRGRLVGEIGELRGLHTKDLESIKAFVTRTHETWIPKYKEFAVNFPRRLIFVGTTNQDEFLADETGNRRWLPVVTGEVDVEGIERDRALLWAEARELFLQGGVQYREAQTLATEVHEAHTIRDAWQDIIDAWLNEEDITGTSPRERGGIRTSDVLRSALHIDDRHIGRREEMRVGKVLRDLGYTRKKLRLEAGLAWVYHKNPG